MSFKFKIKHGWNKLRFYISFLLLTFYLIIGFLFVFTNTWVDMIPKGRVTIGIVILAFGALRFFVAYRRYKKKHARIHSLKEEKQIKEKNEKVSV
jgi:cytochrome c biogenesis protein CcdA